MALSKQIVNVNFGQGLDLKTDPFQLQPGKFLALQNSVFDTGGRLTKRNGYGPLTVLPDASNTFITTFNGDLTAIGSSLSAFSEPTNSWVNKGTIQPISLNTLPLIRSNTNQSQADAAIATNGLVCTVFTDIQPSGPVYKYVVADSATGQNIIAPTIIVGSGGGVVAGSPRVFILGAYFLIVFTNVITATNHLEYLAVSTTNPIATPILGTIANAYIPASTVAWDGIVYGNTFYISYNNVTGGQNISIKTITSTLIVSSAVVYAGEICTMMSMTVDASNPSVPIIWAAYYDLASMIGKAFAVSANLGAVLAPTLIIPNQTMLNITCTAQSGILTFFVEQANAYTYDTAIPTNLIQRNTLTQSGTLGTPIVLVRSVGLASKALLYNGISYFITAYSSPFQPSYFLMNGSGDTLSRFAYSNGGGYRTLGLSNFTLKDGILSSSYLIKDLIAATNKLQGSTNPSPVYSQTGINLINFNLASHNVLSAEIGTNLNLTGGFISGYDGYTITEQNFFVWPDSVEVTTMTGSGGLTAQQYFYQVTYEWADNAGNVFRSAPSIPTSVTTSTASSTNTINVPTLRLTYKTANPVKIVVYRWSTAQQNYYAIQSPSAVPVLNNLTVDYVAISDAAADSAILGNPLIYTTGSVLEDIAPPSSDIMTLFNNRLWLVDSEDTNLLWFSKQVIESTPAEMSDLLTIFIAPTTGSQGSTGPITALSPMDDKLIIFKQDALGYINGIGPDNTGANSGYSEFTLINSVVGCTNQKSIVFMPQGLMFQSDKGIWLIGRDLGTSYIGAPVESLTQGATVQSALNIPTTNQVRFTLDTGITLMYDYYYGQWGTFVNVPAVSSTIYESMHTYINTYGQVFQETPGVYLDNTSPVLMSFTTGWINIAGLQGFERFYEANLLGTYVSPFNLNVQFGFNYNPNPVQSTIVSPAQINSTWGSDALWGSGTTWGSASNELGLQSQANVFEARIFPQMQKCESFQVIINEVFNSRIGTQAGGGFTLSGLSLVAGMKKGSRTNRATRSFG